MMARRPHPIVARVQSMAAPTGGWNARDALQDMDPKDAVVMTNWFPQTDAVSLRGGYSSFATGMGSGAVESLIEWVGSTAKLLAGANSNIYDISSGTPSSLGSGYTNNRWQYVNFSTTGGRYVVMVNGADAPINYNGTVIAAPAITGSGLTSSNLIAIEVFRQRLFFAENGTLKFWYLPALAISGAALEYDLAQFCRRGGTLTAIGTWTRDAGFGGSDDLLVFITSEGECLIFTGTDPSSASTWSMVGQFVIGKPIGRRCLVKFGRDLVVICQDGIVKVADIMGVDLSQQAYRSLSSKISKAFVDAARSYSGTFGWQGVIYPRGNMAVFNVPQSSTVAQQYVVNTITGAWCNFTNQNASCWGLFNGDIYFGAMAGGAVYKADTGANDNAANIVGDLQTAFTYPAGRASQKRFTMARPIFSTTGNVQPSIGVQVDYEVGALDAPVTSVASGGLWDAVNWDGFNWGGAASIQRDWISVSGIGYAVSLRLGVATKTATIRLNSWDLAFEPGGIV